MRSSMLILVRFGSKPDESWIRKATMPSGSSVDTEYPVGAGYVLGVDLVRRVLKRRRRSQHAMQSGYLRMSSVVTDLSDSRSVTTNTCTHSGLGPVNTATAD